MASSTKEEPTRKRASDLARLYAPHIAGKVVLVTGVSQYGLGSAFVKAIAASHPSLLVLAGRNVTKAQATADEVAGSAASPSTETRILQLDLCSLSAVRAAAATVNGWADVPRIDVVVNNAGIMATEFALSPDGYESQFATNHLGPFLFTNLIMDKILASSSPRIVMVSSDGHQLCPVRFADYNFRAGFTITLRSTTGKNDGETYNKWRAYGQSKTANMLMAISLAEKLGPKRNLLAFSLHPGNITTHIGDHINWEADFGTLLQVHRDLGNARGWRTTFPFVPPDEGTATHVYASFDPEIAAHNGSYLEDCQLANLWDDSVKPWATSSTEAERLWKLSEKLVGQEFNY
ncbi:retinol dehydrogenase 13, partial [Sodiomyces alkalinus F11]